MRSLAAGIADPDVEQSQLDELVAGPLQLLPILAEDNLLATTPTPGPLLEVLTRRYYKIRDLGAVTTGADGVVRADYVHHGRRIHVLAARARPGALDEVAGDRSGEPPRRSRRRTPRSSTCTCRCPAGSPSTGEALSAELAAVLARRRPAGAGAAGGPDRLAPRRGDGGADVPPARRRRRAAVLDGRRGCQPSADDPTGFEEDVKFRGLHPMIARRLQMWRLANFEISRLPAAGDVHLFDCVGRENRSDERLVAVAEVRDITPVRDETGRAVAIPEVESHLVAALDAIRQVRAERPDLQRLEWNRIMLYVWPPIDIPLDELTEVARRLVPLTEGLGLEQIVVSGRFAGLGADEPVETVMRLGYEAGRGLTVRMTPPPTAPMQPLDDYTRKLIQTRRRGLVYPYELVPLLCGERGTFVEHDLDEHGLLVPVERPPGQNRAGVVVGVVSTPTERYPEGVTRVALLGDPTRAMGSITEAECRRVLAAIDLAAAMDVPIEWFALSAGAKIAMDSGSENLDWVARVLRRLVEHTQHGGEVNIVVAGINVGAQPYWNAEATMLMHTRGILVMTPGERHGADGQAGDRLLRRCVRRGQLRHRRLRPGDGTERRGAVLGAQPGGGVRGAVRPLRRDLPGSGRAVAAPGGDEGPRRP